MNPDWLTSYYPDCIFIKLHRTIFFFLLFNFVRFFSKLLLIVFYYIGFLFLSVFLFN